MRCQSCVARCLPHRMLVRQACGVADELRQVVPAESLESAAAGGQEQPVPAALLALRRLYARKCSSDADLEALEAGLAASLGAGAASSSPLSLYDLARVLNAFELAEWQPSALCLQRAAQWLTAPRAAGTWHARERTTPAWCLTCIARAWGRFAVWRACDTDAGADSVECRTLPAVVGALQGCTTACAAARRAVLEDVQRGIASELATLDSADALACAKRGMGSMWGLRCTLAALQRFRDGCMCAARPRTCLRGCARVMATRPHACCYLHGRSWRK